MVTEDQAKNIVLEHINQPGNEDEFIVSDIFLSDRKDYWVVCANTRGCLIDDDPSSCYIGVSAYLVHCQSGELEIVGSAISSDLYLQDKYDTEDANGQHYVLCCDIDESNKNDIFMLHQALGCSLPDAQTLVKHKQQWFTGKKRYLEEIQNLFSQQNIPTRIILVAEVLCITEIDEELHWWDSVKKLVNARLLK